MASGWPSTLTSLTLAPLLSIAARAPSADVVDAEDARQIRRRLQHVFGHGQRGVALLLAVLLGDDLDVGVFLHRRFKAAHAPGSAPPGCRRGSPPCLCRPALSPGTRPPGSRRRSFRADERIQRPFRLGVDRHHHRAGLVGGDHRRLYPTESVGLISRISTFFCSMSSTSPICLATSWRASATYTLAPISAAA